MNQPDHEDDHRASRAGEKGANGFVVDGVALGRHQT